MGLPDSKATICNLALSYAQIGKRVQDFDNDKSAEAGICRDHYDLVLDEVLGRYRWPWAEAQSKLSKLGSAAWDATKAYAKGDTASFGTPSDAQAITQPPIGGPLALVPGQGNRVYLSLADANTNHQPDTSGTYWRQVSRDGWGFVYRMPDDCVKPREIYSGVRAPRDFETFPHHLGYDQTLGKLLLCDDDTPDLRYTARVSQIILYPAAFVNALAARLAAPLASGAKGDMQLAAAILRKQPPGLYETFFGDAITDSASMQQDGQLPESSFITCRY